MTCDTTIINSMKLETFRVYFSVNLSVVFFDVLHQFEGKSQILAKHNQYIYDIIP